MTSEEQIVAEFARGLSVGLIVGIGRVDTRAWRVELARSPNNAGFNWRDLEGPDPFTAMKKVNAIVRQQLIDLVASELTR